MKNINEFINEAAKWDILNVHVKPNNKASYKMFLDITGLSADEVKFAAKGYADSTSLLINATKDGLVKKVIDAIKENKERIYREIGIQYFTLIVVPAKICTWNDEYSKENVDFISLDGYTTLKA